MKITKTNTIIYSILALAVLVAMYSIFRNQKLNKRLNKIEAERAAFSKDSLQQRNLFRIDSLLIVGEYRSALNAYKEQFNTIAKDDKENVKFRIEVAKQFVNLHQETSENNSISDSLQVIDTSSTRSVATSLQIRSYDSLSFALEKTKVQLNRIKKQLKKKSYGEYLTFRNPKKHQLHYVGQVRYKKANGYGIALFDTGSRYEGQWQDNLRQGEGSFYWPDGEYYKGEYDNDLRNGVGTYFWPNGEKYVGQWKNDQRDGEGVFYGKDGKIITSGVWKKDKLVEERKN